MFISNVKLLLKISRPHFWTYLGGTFLVGYTLATRDTFSLLNPHFLLLLVYFLVFANLFLYGINDWFDEDTDALNEKKGPKENLLKKEQKKVLKYGLIASLCASAFAFFLLHGTERILFALFIFLSYAYSAPPFRFKSKPFIDFLSNALYILPGLIGYSFITHTLPTPPVLIACFCWSFAMHLFSAIPDIDPDRKAGITTTAVFLGKTNSLILCLAFWLVFSSIIVAQKSFFPFTMISIIYPSLPAMLLTHKHLDIAKIYWYYPYINGILGFGTYLISVVYK
jgi:4-hydroxybenzoate polyprenyltransferase